MMNAPLPDLLGEQRTKPVSPEPNRLVADIDATFEQQIFNLPQWQRVTDVHHNREANHLGQTIEITVGTAHPNMLRDGPICLKPFALTKLKPAHKLP
jgi:hypothetical protein